MGGPAPEAVLADAKNKLDSFAKQLNDYADQLEHAQHDHLIQMALMGALTVANIAQLGLDPATDAAEVGETTAAVVSSRLANFGTIAFREAAIGGFSDLFAQAGANVWDRLDSGFDTTGDHAVGLFDPVELITSTAEGAIGGALLAGTARLVNGALQRVGADSLLGAVRSLRGRVNALPGSLDEVLQAGRGDVDLAYQESLGGHTISRHVGLTDGELRASAKPIHSTFTDQPTAQAAVSETVRDNAPTIRRWLATQSSPTLTLTGFPPGTLGRVRLADGSITTSNQFKVVLMINTQGEPIVLTAFPTP
ncbi:MAG: hypothetical protein JOZ75_11425 [Candidatus Dormibacteraeota bacterium]|nr:hypothetical protein [Candidatus Dormibacteraeota bacterium]